MAVSWDVTPYILIRTQVPTFWRNLLLWKCTQEVRRNIGAKLPNCVESHPKTAQWLLSTATEYWSHHFTPCNWLLFRQESRILLRWGNFLLLISFAVNIAIKVAGRGVDCTARTQSLQMRYVGTTCHMCVSSSSFILRVTWRVMCLSWGGQSPASHRDGSLWCLWCTERHWSRPLIPLIARSHHHLSASRWFQ
jgi:hypothetical protein